MSEGTNDGENLITRQMRREEAQKESKRLDDKLDQLLKQSDSHTRTLDKQGSALDLISVKLFGSEEDHYSAGRLPLLEARLAATESSVASIENIQMKENGAGAVLLPVLRWLGVAFIAILASWLTWAFQVGVRLP